MAEMMGYPRTPLFPGQTYLGQLDQIISVLGTPHRDDIMGHEKALNYMKTLPYKSGVDFRQKYPNASHHALDLLSKLLTFNPNKRITVDQALEHPYFANGRIYEPLCEKFEFKVDESMTDFKQIIYDLILRYKQTT
jgi:mitogen-activated protein kinase 1/3